MKYTLYLLLGLFSFNCINAQEKTTTIILLRHAEKATADMNADPPLSAAGLQRAARLPELLKEYHPDLLFSTNFIRTKTTLAPLAAHLGKQIAIYDPSDLSAFAARLLALEGKTVVVAGHSNTTPALVNLLIHQNTYPALEDNNYNTYWIVTVKNGTASARKISY